ncbi:MAG: signal peptidase I [Bacillota bacterium]
MSELLNSTVSQQSQEEAVKARRRMPAWLEMVVTILVAVVIALSVRMFVFEITRVDGPSMRPTLYTDEQILVNKLAYAFGGTPNRFDIVICRYPGSDAHYVKRVIGLPGETISVQDGRVYINGKPLEKDTGAEPMIEPMQPVVVPNGHVFVMGDNRNDSMDSRQEGPIEMSEIIGRATAVVWPLNALKWLG